MATEKKFFLNRLDEINVVVDFLVKSPTRKVILNIPRDSVLGKSIHNFQILKREGDTAEKEIVIESIDDHILELGGLVGITSVNPVFRLKEKSVSDILPRASFPKKKTLKIDEGVYESKSFDDFKAPKIIKESKIKEPRVEEILKEEREVGERHFNLKKWILFFSFILFFVLIVWGVGFKILPKVTVSITLKKITAPFNDSFEASSKVKQVEFKSGKFYLPAELLVNRKNLEMSFEAHGKERGEVKATGNLVIYNAYSSQPQILVKSTRFESPDKKIFRLDSQVTVPGAKIVNGKIEPSKIEVKVTADVAGEEYNIPETSFRIPGFKGTPRYDGFYAESLRPMSGGFIGERNIPTEEDLGKAREAIKQALENILKSENSLFIGDRFKNLEGTTSFKFIKEDIKLQNNAQTFGIFAEAEMRNLVFEEEMLKNSLIKREKEDLSGDLRVYDFNLDYGKPDVDLTLGRMNFKVQGSIIFEENLVLESLITSLLGKDEKAINSILSDLPGLEKAQVSLWPFWVKRVPNNPKKLKVIID